MTHYLEANKTAQRQFRRPRRGTPTGCIVVHTAESIMDSVGPDTGAENVARFMLNRSDYGSYHRLVDSDSIVDLVGFGAEAYGDGAGSNKWACHISAACRTTDWVTMSRTRRAGFIRNLAKAAAEYARWVRKTRNVIIPAKRITRAESEAGKPGFLGHGERDPGRRSDPGAQFPWDEFLDAYAEEFPLARASTKANAASAARAKAKKHQPLRRALLVAEKAARKVGRTKFADNLKARRIAFRFQK